MTDRTALIVDASAIVAALLDGTEDGIWARAVIDNATLYAPHLLPAEAAAVVRRAAVVGAVTEDAASLAHADLAALRCRYLPYEPFADRVWELRANVPPFDAWYVAVAEELKAPLVTLDRRLANAPGTRCEVVTP